MKVLLKKMLVVVAVGMFVLPSFGSAQTVEELQAQIRALLAQIAQLQAQINAQQNAEGWCYTFTANLRVGDRGVAVDYLQRALKKEDFAIASAEQLADPIFGESTASAVVGFQEKYASQILRPNGLDHGTRYVGPSTRRKLNALYGCRTIQQSSITVLSPTGIETFSPGQQVTVRYVLNHFPRPVNTINVQIQLNKGAVYPNGPFHPAANTSYVPATGSYTFTIPSNAAPGSDYSFMISPDYPTTETPIASSRSNNFAVAAYSDRPSISVSVDSSSPASRTLFTGQTDVILAAIRLRAMGGSVGINSISVGVNPAGNGSAARNIKVYDGLALLGTIAGELPNTGLRAQNVRWGSIPIPTLTLSPDVDKVLTLKANIASNARGAFRLGIVDLGYDIRAQAPIVSEFNGLANLVTVAPSAERSLETLSPNGRENFELGTSIPVRWTQTFGSRETKVRVIDASSTIIYTSPQISSNSVVSGDNVWSLPANAIQNPGRYRVNVCSQSGKINYCDPSNAFFNVTGERRVQTPMIFTIFPSGGVIVRNRTYDFAISLSGAEPNTLIYFSLQRPDGSMKYNRAPAEMTDAQGNFSTTISRTIENEGQTGAWRAWVTAGNSSSNTVQLNVIGE